MTKIRKITLIIGAMKSGTTSLFSYLDQHPQICSSKEKEPMFFSRVTWEKGMKHYETLWPDFDPNRHATVMEASTEYTKIPTYPNAADRILQFANKNNVDFKFIYIVRDPLAMISSGIKHGQDAGWGTTRQELFDHLLSVTDYAMQISKYFQRFPKDDILLLKFEDLVKNPRDVIYKVTNFLDLDQSFQFSNLETVFNSEEQRKISQHEKKLKNKIDELKFVHVFSKFTPGPVNKIAKQMAYALAIKIFTTPEPNVKSDWSLTDQERQFIIGKLKPSLIELETKYGLDLSDWKTFTEAK